MKLEKSTSVDQLDHPALRLLAARPELFTRQGHVVAGWRRLNGKTFGPYYRLGYREGGRQHSVYLGREGALVERIRRTLESIQRPRAEHRTIRRLERQVLASLRIEKIRLGSLLRPYGLRLKGMEVRGWRCSPLRRFLTRRRRLKPRISVPGWKPVVRVCGKILWQLGHFVILSAAKNLVFPVARARFFAALRMTELARKFGRTLVRRPNPDPPAVRLARYLEARGRSRLPGGTCVLSVSEK